MEIITVVKKCPYDELVTYAFSSLQSAIKAFPIIAEKVRIKNIADYNEILFEIESHYGMTINNRDININVKKCFVY